MFPPTRAQAVGSRSEDTCCQRSGNECASDGCIDQTSSADFLFRLQPGDPQRFLPRPYGNTYYQYAVLSMGYTGPLATATSTWATPARSAPPTGHCGQGYTYAGSNNEVCGGYNNWGETKIEVWRLE